MHCDPNNTLTYWNTLKIFISIEILPDPVNKRLTDIAANNNNNLINIAACLIRGPPANP